MKLATCHPERKHYGHGLCRKCYDRAWQTVYRASHKTAVAARMAIYHQAHKAESIAAGKRTAAKLKLEVLKAYGGPKCACCGETLVQGLSIDHINGGGTKHIREIHKQGSGFHRWLKKHGFPPGYQVLCFTCNFAKGTGDHCPHKERTQ